MRPRSLLMLAALLAITGAACTQTLDRESLEETLAQQLEDRLDETGITVTCPDDVEVQAGGVFTCTAVGADGAGATIEVTQQDDAGRVEWRIVDAAAGDEAATGGGES